MNTIKYKTGFIHENFTTGVIRVQVDGYAYPIECKSIFAAKLIITKHTKKYRVLK